MQRRVALGRPVWNDIRVTKATFFHSHLGAGAAKWLGLIGAIALSLTSLGCKPEGPAAAADPASASAPAAPLWSQAGSEPALGPQSDVAFVHYMLEHLEPTLDQVTCHCCGKTLGACYRGMVEGARGSCPFT